MNHGKVIITSTHQKSAENVKLSLQKGKKKLFYKDWAIDLKILQSNLSPSQTARFFMNIKEEFTVMIIIEGSSLYQDILYACKILSFCKDAFIILIDDTNTLNEDCAFIITEQLKTQVYFYKNKKKKLVSSIKKDIIKFANHKTLSGYIQKYPDIISRILPDLANALGEKNEFLSALAPFVLTSSKTEITKMCNEIGFDILDNLNVLKSICVAMEFLNDCQIKKSDILSLIKNTQEIFASDLLSQIDTHKSKEKIFNFFSKNLKCPSFISNDK